MDTSYSDKVTAKVLDIMVRLHDGVPLILHACTAKDNFVPPYNYYTVCLAVVL